MPRIIKIKNNNEWIERQFQDIKKGDIFKAYDDDEPVTDEDGNTEFIAVSDPNIYEVGEDLLSIDVEPYKDAFNELEKRNDS